MKRLDQLTFTRFIAALSVVTYHLGRNVFPFNIYPIDPLFASGSLAVGYFFVLSGFVMSLVYFRPGQPFDFKGYWLARFSRIYPIYLVSLLLTSLHFLDLVVGVDSIEYLSALLLLQAWIPEHALTFNFPAWSLSIEVFFYLIFPLLAIWLGRKSVRGMIWGSVIFWAAVQVILFGLAKSLPDTLQVENLLSYFPLVHVNSFILGVVGGVWYVSVGQKTQPGQSMARGVFVVGLIAVSTALLMKGNIGFHLSKGLLAPFFLVVVLALAIETSLLARLLSHPWLVRLGDASYGVYILHMPVSWLYADLLHLVGINMPEIWTFYSYVVLLVALSLILHAWMERPARDWLRQNSAQLKLILLDALLLAAAIWLSFFLRVGARMREYSDVLNLAVRMGVPVYVLLSIIFRFYTTDATGRLLEWVKRSLLPVSLLGGAALMGILFWAQRTELIGPFPRSLPLVNLFVSFTLLLLLRVGLRTWNTARNQ